MNQKIFTRAAFRIATILLVAAALVFTGNPNIALASPPSGHGSTFEDADGNLKVDNTGMHDWNNPIVPIVCPPSVPGSGTNCGLDLVNSKNDNALGQGTKEDDPVPTVVKGSIPPSKDDLSRFYINLETVGSGSSQKLFLYLAWERSNLLGSAHMDFELNQDATLSSNGVTPVRTEGDILIDYDFGGSGVPVLALHRWIDGSNNETPADCEASNTLSCWDHARDLTAGGEAEAQVNSAPVTDTNAPNAPFTLDGNTKNGVNSTFGEAGIDLTEANIFPSDVCSHFGAAWLKSRSSGNSFTSEMKDFIAPIPVNISNCGNIIIRKVTDPSPDPTNTSFDYSTTGGLDPASFSLMDGGKQDYGSMVFAGNYTVTETDPGPEFTLDKLDCSASSVTNGSSVSTDLVTGKVTISLVADDVVDCTYTNKLQQGAVAITKTSTKGDAALAGAKFDVSGPSGDFTLTSGSDGVACVDKLQFGDYTVKETSAPTGYKVDDTGSHTVTVNANSTCGDGNEATFAFSDTPLSKITVSFQSLAGPGVTTATIQCTGEGSASALPEGTPKVLTDLEPGTYSCTVVVDP